MLSKGLITRTGEYGTSQEENSSTMFLYSPSISFGEYYCECFKKISSQNLFCLVEKILRSGKFNPSMLQSLDKIIIDRLKEAPSNPEKKYKHIHEKLPI